MAIWKFLPLLAVLPLVQASCPYGFELVKDECRGNYSWIETYSDEAKNEIIAKCQGILGLPIIIHSPEDQSYWTSHISQEKSTYTAMGLHCNSSTMKWQWADGSPLDFKPESYDDPYDEDCVARYSPCLTSNGHWSFFGGHYEMSTDIFCTVPIRQPDPSEDGCDSFEGDSEDGVCYQVGATAEDWQEAQMICRSFGADIASVHNQKENSFIRRLAVSKGALSGMFLGAAIMGKGNAFGWIDGSDWDYDNFYPGFPVNGLGDCIVMDTSSTSGEWANVDCSSKMSVACQREQHYSPPNCSSGPWREGQIIYSPGFPFDASVQCDFILSVDTGKTVQVEILLLEANPCCDHLIVYESYIGSNIIANLTGQISDETYTTRSSNFMRVSWQPNGGVNVRGMMMTFRGV